MFTIVARDDERSTGSRVPHHQEHRFNIDIHDAIPFSDRAVVDGPDQHDACIVDQMIDSLKSLDDLIDRAMDFVLTGDIDRKCFAGSPEGSDLVLRGAALLRIDIEQRYARSLFRESVSDCEAIPQAAPSRVRRFRRMCAVHASMPPGWRTNTSGS